MTSEASNSIAKLRHRSVPIPETLESVPNYPKKLVIFKIAASPFYQVRYFSQSKVVKRSCKTEKKSEAIAFAKKFYEDVLLAERNLLPISKSPTFEKFANLLIEEQEALIERHERNAKLNINDKQKLKTDLLPFFRNFHVKDITYKHINDYITHLSKRGLKPATLKVHLVLIRKILNLACRENLLDRLPLMPKIRMKDSPRGSLSTEEYRHLKQVAKQIIEDKTNKHLVRRNPITYEMSYLISFMVNTFLRPSDVKSLRHRNIEIVETPNTFLRIFTDSSKTSESPIVSMPAAVKFYKELKTKHVESNKPINKEDFVFFPDILNRNVALDRMSRSFDYILKHAELKKTPNNQVRTLYSLRHTAIMLRLIRSKDLDLLTLARNARTSVEMIQRFYAKHLQPESNIEKLQSFR